VTTLVRAGMTPAQRCRYVADLIEAHPEHFDMSDFVRGADYDSVALGESPLDNCGMTCCIGGWAVAVTPAHERPDAQGSYGANADLLLDLNGRGDYYDYDGDERDNGLFYDLSLEAPDAAFLLRWHADELDRA